MAAILYARNDKGNLLPANQLPYRTLSMAISPGAAVIVPFEHAAFPAESLVSQKGRPLPHVPKLGEPIVMLEDRLHPYMWTRRTLPNGTFEFEKLATSEYAIDKDFYVVEGGEIVPMREEASITATTTAGLGAYVNDLAMDEHTDEGSYNQRESNELTAAYAVIFGGDDQHKLRPVNVAVVPRLPIGPGQQVSVAYGWPYWKDHFKAIFRRSMKAVTAALRVPKLPRAL
eukprot:tig00001387_g8567.t1